MKSILLFSAIAATLVSVSLVSHSCGSAKVKNQDTLRINTTALCEDVIGFNGPTPVEITVVKGVVTKVEPLQNREGPRYMQAIREAGLFDKLVGKTMEEAKAVELDAVTGATFSSKALIENIKRGLADGGFPGQRPQAADAGQGETG